MTPQVAAILALEQRLADIQAEWRWENAERVRLNAAVARDAVALCRQLQSQLAREQKDAARYRWLRDGCRNVQSAEAMERILANWMEWTPLEGDMAIDAEIVK